MQFFKAIKAGNLESIVEMLKIQKYLVYDYDFVYFLICLLQIYLIKFKFFQVKQTPLHWYL